MSHCGKRVSSRIIIGLTVHNICFLRFVKVSNWEDNKIHYSIILILSNQSVLVESPVSLAVSPGVISLDPSLSESPLSAPSSSVSPAVGRKGGAGGGKNRKKKKDPNEPQKPVSAYALFFRDTQAAIKGQNPNATFGEVSKIVASMWDSLGEEQKQVRGRQRKLKPRYLQSWKTWNLSF